MADVTSNKGGGTWNGYHNAINRPCWNAIHDTHGANQISVQSGTGIEYADAYLDVDNNIVTAYGASYFRAPVAGNYFFFFGMAVDSNNGSYVLKLRRNYSFYNWNGTSSGQVSMTMYKSSNHFPTKASRVFIHWLEKMDTVDVVYSNGPSGAQLFGGDEAYFGGFLIS
jgi:hypothetical protein